MTETPMNKPSIRILQVLTIMNRGGAEAMIMNYYRNVDRNQIQFDFLLHRQEKGAYDDEILSLGGKIYKLRPIHPRSLGLYEKELDDFFKQNTQYRIVHSHLNALSSIVLGVAKKNGVQIRIAHSHLAVEKGTIWKLFHKDTDRTALVKDFIQHIIRHRVRRVATHNFACGEKAGKWLFGEYGNFNIINNAIDSSKFIYNPNLRTSVREKLNLGTSKTIGHVGRFNEQKNHFYLIRIFHALLNIDSNYHLLLVGDGNLTQKVRKLTEELNISEKVTFLGIRKDIPDLLQAMDFFVFPSLYEGLPVTLVEAQASGLKIFASNNITHEVNLTGLISFLEINDPPEKWALKIIEESNYTRKNTSLKIKEMQYDIHENALSLQNFYLNQLK